MNLYPHQETGAAWLREHPRGGLFDEQGLGKTATAIIAARRAGVERMLVLAPTVVAHNWKRELGLWAPRWCVQVIARGCTEIVEHADVVVVTHGLLLSPMLRRALLRRQWDLLVVDEAQCFKNHHAKRTRVLYAGTRLRKGQPPVSLVSRCKRVHLLTGTPMPNNPAELWTHLFALAPELIIASDTNRPMTFTEFRARYCKLEFSPHTPDNVRIVGTKNVLELKRRLDGFYVRRLLKDCLDLPPMRWGVVALTIDKLPKELKEIEGQFEIQNRHPPTINIERLREHASFSTWRRLCGIAKAPAAAELLKEELDGTTHKVVVVVHHLEVGNILERELAPFGVVRIDGAVTGRHRQDRVDAFQTGRPRVALINIVAGGVGITLTAAQQLVFVESSFVPGENLQAAYRVHRIGQTGSVLVRVLSLADSVDELVAEVTARKAEMIMQVLS